jgi:hypothetical protein
MKSDLVQTGTYVLSAIALAGTKYSKHVLKKLFDEETYSTLSLLKGQ